MTDDELLAHFESCTLPHESFHHRDHVKMALLYLRSYPPLQALEHFSAALGRFAAANGKSQLYNETITWAFVFLIRERPALTGPDLERVCHRECGPAHVERERAEKILPRRNARLGVGKSDLSVSR